jgi:hypothetical protein
MQTEQISPELVLVDPELRRLALPGRIDAPAAPPRRSTPSMPLVEPFAPRRRTTDGGLRAAVRSLADRLTFNLLVVSIIVNLVFAGTLMAGATEAPRLEPLRRATTPPAPAADAKADAERAVLALIQTRPLARLAPRLVDRSTGGLRNNVQAVCRHTGADRFLCIVRPPEHRNEEGLEVRYRRLTGGGGAAELLDYRNG